MNDNDITESNGVEQTMRDPGVIAQDVLDRLAAIRADEALQADIDEYQKEMDLFHRDVVFAVTSQSSGLMLGILSDPEAIKGLSVLGHTIATLAFAAGRRARVEA